ncbi:MAG TPA: HAMP domain-containing sensor histidine kinase [Lachnospiraceae bacterium]|nr:HAMP domain-containing sensor histidine kinase [Lachnospiraceae bacterium]
MAHELNNPLTAVKLGLQNLKGMMKDSEQAQTQFRHAESAAQRCGRIVNDLLALSREPHLDTSVHLETVVQKTIAIFRQEFSGNVTVETVIASSLPPVSVDRIQIQQALMNVLINAFEAMKGKGVITVSVSDENRQIAVRIKNSGPGVPDHILSRVFEPFFTTKEMGKGSGLGLAITAQLVQKNGGTVAMEKSETGSVVFLMRFPAGLTVDPNPSFRDSYVILSSDKAGKEE